jgi:hypothetical protein
MIRRYLLLIVALFFVGVSTACQSEPPKPGFRISMYRTTTDIFTGLPTTFPHQNILLSGAWDRDIGSPTGSLTVFLGRSSGSVGYVDVAGGRAPAVWELTEDNGPCAGQTVAEQLYPGENEDIYCTELPFFLFNASPSFIDKTDPPTSITINGSGISSAGGIPTVEYWDSYGNMIGQQPATSVASDGTWLTGPVPNLTDSGTGRFAVRVKNPDGALAGIAYIDVWYPYVYEPPPPPPGGCGENSPNRDQQICEFQYY